MAWTAIAAAIIVIRRAVLGASIDISDVYESASDKVMQILFAVLCAPAVGILFTWPCWRRLGFAFPAHGGDWLLVVMGVDCCLRIGGEAYGHMSGNAGSPMSFGVLAAIFGVNALCYACATVFHEAVGWRITFATLGIAPLIMTATVTRIAVAAFADLPFPDDDWLTHLARLCASFWGVILAAPVLIALGIDLVWRRSLPWTHWLGVALFLTGKAWYIGNYLWQSYAAGPSID